MTDHEQLVKALRCCAENFGCPIECPRYSPADEGVRACVSRLEKDAADAIEALQADIKRLKEVINELREAQTYIDHYGGKWLTSAKDVPTAAYEHGYADGRGEAEAQFPKREEVWKDVIGYEGLYQVSDQARVRNNKGKILKQSVKVGKCVYYKYVKLYKDGQYRQGYVHRMMAECFIPNPDNLPIINHKDEDGTNNRLDNLEWCTVEYNSNYGNAKRNMSRGKRRRAKMEVQE